MDEDRSEVEVTIQVGLDTDEEVLSVMSREARRAVKEALKRGSDMPEYVHETQWCSGAMRVTVRRPHLPPLPPPKDPPPRPVNVPQ